MEFTETTRYPNQRPAQLSKPTMEGRPCPRAAYGGRGVKITHNTIFSLLFGPSP